MQSHLTSFYPQDLRRLPLLQIHVVMAIRCCAICETVGRDPMEQLAVKFGSVTAAKAIIALSQALLQVWPEPFAILRGCCMLLSHDEQQLARMLGFVTEGDRHRFDQSLADLMVQHDINYLFRATALVAGALQRLVSSQS